MSDHTQDWIDRMNLEQLKSWMVQLSEERAVASDRILSINKTQDRIQVRVKKLQGDGTYE